MMLEKILTLIEWSHTFTLLPFILIFIDRQFWLLFLQEVFFYLQENIFYLDILFYKNFTKIWLSVTKLILEVE